nr:unnamed protein product [Digitaria exilis]
MHPPPPPQPEPATRRSSSTTTCSTAPRRTIGCMAGLLRLISPYHRSHHRKRLIAKLNAAQHASSAPPSQPSSPPKKKPPPPAPAAAVPAVPPSPKPSPVKTTTQQQQTPPAAVRRRRSCDAPRSPTIAPEHRRSSCDSPRPPPPAIVARLMGLEESAPPSPSPAAAPAPPRRPVVVLPMRPPPPPPAAPATPETAAEKRRKLLGALEKCDEDLKTLRRIIAAVRAAEMRAVAASPDLVAPVAAKTPPAASKAGAQWTVARDEHSPSPSPLSSQQQYPSPDSVLDAISSPRFPCRKRPSPCATTDTDAVGKPGCGNGAVAPTVGSKIVKPSRTLVFSGGDYWKIRPGDELQLHIHCPVPVVVGMPRSAGSESWRHHLRRWEMEAAAAGRVISRAMAESAGEATMWGAAAQQQGDHDEQSRERGRVAAALEGAIVQDLVAELLSDLLALSGHGGRAGCRKRLCF